MIFNFSAPARKSGQCPNYRHNLLFPEVCFKETYQGPSLRLCKEMFSVFELDVFCVNRLWAAPPGPLFKIV